jgi:two-component system response regulator PilR (NtrC family)
VGSEHEIDVDFRVISASHQDLETLVQQGQIPTRFILPHSCDGYCIPPLRERGQDI